MKRNILIAFLIFIFILTVLLFYNRSKVLHTKKIYEPDYFFSNEEDFKCDIVSRNIYTFSSDETPFLFRGGLSTVRKDRDYYNISTIDKKGYRKMINGQIFSDVVISPDYDDFFILVDNNLIYNDNKFDIYEKRFDYSFSPNGDGMIFSIAGRIFYKGKYIDTVGDIYSDNLFFSSDGKKAFYSIAKNEDEKIRTYLCDFNMGIIDSIPGRLDSIDISPFRSELVYSSKSFGRSVLEIKKDNNTIFEGVFSDIKNPLFSPDGEKFSCIITDSSGKDNLYIDSNIIRPKEDLILESGFSNDSKHFYYLTFDVKENKKTLYVDNKKIIEGIDITDIELFGDNYICRVSDDKGEFIYFNGKSSTKYKRLSWFCFSNDRSTLVYVAQQDNTFDIFVNGKNQKQKYQQVSNILYFPEEKSFRFSAISDDSILNVSLSVKRKNKINSKMFTRVDETVLKAPFLSGERFDNKVLSTLLYKKDEKEKRQELFSEKYDRIMSYLDDSKPEEAMKLIDELLKMYPDDQKLMNLKVKVFFLEKDVEGALDYLLILFKKTENDLYLSRVIDFYWDKHSYNSIIEIIEDLLDENLKINKKYIDRALYSSLFLNDQKVLQRLLRKAEKQDVESSTTNIVKVYLAIKKGDLKRAGSLLNNNIYDQKDPVFLALKGIVLAYEDRLPEAVYFLTRSLLQREDDDVLMARAEVFIRMGEFLKAARDIESISYLSKDRVLKERLAHLYYDACHYAKAENIISNLIKKYPADATYYNALAWMKATCSDPAYRDGKEAIRLAKIAYKLRPDLKTKDTLAAAFSESALFKEALMLEGEILQESSREYYRKMYDLYKNRMRFYDAPAK